MAERRWRIEEYVVPGKRLGRQVNHDPRSLYYRVIPDGTIRSVEWVRDIAILDQGQLGSCTGNAGTGVLGSATFYETLPTDTRVRLDEDYAVSLYSDATKADTYPDNYPPTDTGSDGLSIAKVLKTRGLISGYQHITSLAAAQTAIQSGPFITGVNWYEGFDHPDSDGKVKVAGVLRGGHEFEILGYDAKQGLWKAANSWGTGWGKDGYFYISDTDYARLLKEQGDATTFVPVTQPAPTPTPTPTAWPSDIVDPWLKRHHIGETARVAKALTAYRQTLQ